MSSKKALCCVISVVQIGLVHQGSRHTVSSAAVLFCATIWCRDVASHLTLASYVNRFKSFPIKTIDGVHWSSLEDWPDKKIFYTISAIFTGSLRSCEDLMITLTYSHIVLKH